MLNKHIDRSLTFPWDSHGEWDPNKDFMLDILDPSPHITCT